MKRQRVVKEAPFVPRFKRTRGRSRKRERERDRLFASFQNLSIPVKSSRLQLIRLNVLICENVIFFFFFFLRVTRYSRFSGRLNEEISSSEAVAIRSKCRHSRSYASNRVILGWKISRGKFRAVRLASKYVAGECFARETIREMKIQEYKWSSGSGGKISIRKIEMIFRKIKKNKRDTLIHVFRISHVAMRVRSRFVIRSLRASKIFQRNIFPFVPMSVYFSISIKSWIHICRRTVSQP